MHGGSIVVESRIGQGSTFTVELPRDPRLVAGTPAAQQAADGIATPYTVRVQQISETYGRGARAEITVE